MHCPPARVLHRRGDHLLEGGGDGVGARTTTTSRHPTSSSSCSITHRLKHDAADAAKYLETVQDGCFKVVATGGHATEGEDFVVSEWLVDDLVLGRRWW